MQMLFSKFISDKQYDDLYVKYILKNAYVEYYAVESFLDNTILYDIYYSPYLSNIFGNKIYYTSAKIGGKNVFLKLNTENNKLTFFNDSSIMYQYDRETDSQNQINVNGYYVNAIGTSNLNNLYLFSCNCDT